MQRKQVLVMIAVVALLLSMLPIAAVAQETAVPLPAAHPTEHRSFLWARPTRCAGARHKRRPVGAGWPRAYAAPCKTSAVSKNRGGLVFVGTQRQAASPGATLNCGARARWR